MKAGTKSLSSTHEYAASKTRLSTFRQCHVLDQNHSEEYLPPHLSRYGIFISRAASVIASASAYAVWSFHSQAYAFGLSLNLRSNERGIPSLPTGIGVEPVVSTPIPATFSGLNFRSAFEAFFSASETDVKKPSM